MDGGQVELRREREEPGRAGGAGADGGVHLQGSRCDGAYPSRALDKTTGDTFVRKKKTDERVGKADKALLDCILLQGILETPGNPAPLEVIQTDDALHHFSTSLLRIPTKAITTLPRDENMMPINEKPNQNDGEEKKDTAAHIAAALRTDSRAPTYGGNWILGNDKGVYLRATNSSLLGNDETDDDSESVEEFQFPFSGSRQIIEEEDAAAAAETRRREKEEEDLERRREEERAERDRRNDQEAWHFFAGSISRGQAEALLKCVCFALAWSYQSTSPLLTAVSCFL